jgi:hypothetical protein
LESNYVESHIRLSTQGGTILKRIISLSCCLLILAACAGRTPNPVSEYQYGDEKKSCERLRAEISTINTDIATLLPDVDKTGQNVALGVVGLWLIVPWFFMDFSEAEQVEINALRRRHNNLVAIAS